MKTWTKRIQQTKNIGKLRASYITYHADRAFAMGGSIGQNGHKKLTEKFNALVKTATGQLSTTTG